MPAECFLWFAISGLGCGDQASGPDLVYVFELASKRPASVRIHLRVAGTDGPGTMFATQPHWGGIERCGQFVDNLQAFDVADQRLRVEAVAENQWQVEHAPRSLLHLVYELHPLEQVTDKIRSNHYRPIVRDDLVHLIGETCLLFPVLMDDETPRRIEYQWLGFSEAGWDVVSSFGPDPAGKGVQESVQAFRHALFLAGDFRLYSVDLEGRRLQLALNGRKWGFEDAEFVEMAATIVRTEREFWKDFEDPYYLISLLQIPKATPGSISTGGTGLTHSFALFMTPGQSLTPGSPDAFRIQSLLAHEYFHEWNGGKISAQMPSDLCYWFSEGFTDFYAARLLHRAGLTGAEQWLETINRWIDEYWKSPARNLCNADIAKAFWTDAATQDQPYRRGALLALIIDWEIRKDSDGAMSLDDWMQELLENSRAGEKVSTDSLLGSIASFTSEDFAQSVRAIVVDGCTIEFPADLFLPYLEWAAAPDLESTAPPRLRLISEGPF